MAATTKASSSRWIFRVCCSRSGLSSSLSGFHFSRSQLGDRWVGQRLAGGGRDGGGDNSSQVCRVGGNVHRAGRVVDWLDDRRFSGRNCVGSRDGVTGRRSGKNRNGESAASGSGHRNSGTSGLLLGHLVVSGVEILLSLGQPLLKEERVASTSSSPVRPADLCVFGAKLLLL